MSHGPKPFQLGLLLVHGIGTQPSGDTLVRWGDVLFKTIRRATLNQVIARVDAGTLDSSDAGRAEAVLRLQAGSHIENWLLAEGWWAESFPAPTYGELVSWGARALPWSLSINTAQSYWRSAPEDRKEKRPGALAMAVAQFLITLLFSPLIISLLALAWVLGLLPIPRLRAVIHSAQSILTATVGDTLAFVESPVRAGLIRTRILEGLDRLSGVCEHTIIVAHSQGAAAVLDSLGGIVDPGLESSAELPGSMPDTLLTFGAGTNQLVSLKFLSAGMPKGMEVNPAYMALSTLVAACVLLIWMYERVRTHEINLSDILQATLLCLLFLGGMTLLLTGLFKLKDRLAARFPAARKRVNDVTLWTLALLTVAFLLAISFDPRFAHLPFGSINSLIVTLIVLAGSTATILSPQMETAVTKPVRRPPRLGRWIDLYASADPVPNGPTRIAESKGLKSVPIWNQGSLLTDHTSYWENLDGFVLRVVRACAQTAQSPWQTMLPTETSSIDQRAKWRVSFLRLIRWSTVLIWLFLFVVMWRRYRDQIPVPFQPPSWLPPSLALVPIRLALLALVVAFLAWGTLTIVHLPWKVWVRAEQEKVLAHSHPVGKPLLALVIMMMVAWLLVILAVALVGNGSEVFNQLQGGRTLTDVLSISLGWAVISTLGFVWCKPPPQWSDQEAPSEAGERQSKDLAAPPQ